MPLIECRDRQWAWKRNERRRNERRRIPLATGACTVAGAIHSQRWLEVVERQVDWNGTNESLTLSGQRAPTCARVREMDGHPARRMGKLNCLEDICRAAGRRHNNSLYVQRKVC